MALGSGKDLGVVGAVAVDITHSIAHMPQDDGFDGETLQGNSYRISYSRDFDEIDSRLTFAGYRFSEKNFMSMSDYRCENLSSSQCRPRKRTLYGHL